MSLGTVHVSGLPVPLIAALLASAAVAGVDAQTCETELGNCSFKGTFCQWSKRRWSHSSSYSYLSNGRPLGSLTSKYLCVGSAVSHCLQLDYYLNNTNNCSLKLYLSHPHNASKIQLWKTSGGGMWKTARIAVNSDSTFRLVIEGRRKTGTRIREVRIKNVVYDKNNCSNEQVSTTTTVSSSRTRRLTTSTSTPTPVASSRKNTLTTVSSSHSTSSFPVSTHSVTHNSSADGLRGDADSSADVGVTVGVALSAVVVACLIVTLIVFLRWKQLMCWRPQRDDKQTAAQVCFKGEACGASSFNAGTSRNDNYAELDIADASRPHCYTSLGEVRASQATSMENCSTTVRDVSGDPSTLTQSTAALYELAKPVLPSAPNGLVNSGFQSSLDSLYENDGGKNVLQHQEGEGHSDYNAVCFNKRDGKVHAEAVYSDQPPYDHIHNACKSGAGGQGRLGSTLEKDPQMLSHPSLEDEALGGELGGEPSAVYHVLEESEKQNPRVKPASAYQVAKPPLAEVSMKQELENPATSVYHILENPATSVYHILENNGTTPQSGPDDESTAVLQSTEDTRSSHPDPDDAYLVLVAEPTLQLSPHTSEDIYQNLTQTRGDENAACDSRDVIHKSSLPSKPESSPLPSEFAYNCLRFDKTGAAFADREEEGGGGVGDEIYSHLKEGGDGTYDEVRREGRRNVIDEDYSHI